MGYINTRKARIIAKIKQIRAMIDALDATYLALSASLIDSYKFDSGEGSQQTSRKKLNEVRMEIDALEAKEQHYINELYGMGIINMNLRRKRPNEPHR